MQTFRQQTTHTRIEPSSGGILQRACACGQHTGSVGECAECRKKRLAATPLGLQRAPLSQSGREAGDESAPPIVQEVLRSTGQPLDPATRAFMEARFSGARFGQDFSQVRVHTDAKAAKSAQSVNALAYTVGQDIVFSSGSYAPELPSGQRLLGHELTHVVQQQAGAAPSPQTALSIRNQVSGSELEADRAAAQIIQGKQVQVKQSATPSPLHRQPAAPVRSHRFASNGVSVVVRPSCTSERFGFATVEAATITALDRIFNSRCIEESRRIRIQRNLTAHGLDIRCSDRTDVCAEAAGFNIPANILDVMGTSFPANPDSDPSCQPLASSILHEIIHLVRGTFPEALPLSCEASCFGVGGGDADLCREIDVFGRRRPPVGDFPIPEGDELPA
jgi:hypothetical protein